MADSKRPDTAATSRARRAPARTRPSSRQAAFGGEDAALLREYYRQMALIRSFELRAAEMYTRAKIGGYCHLNLGEEATVVGLMAALSEDDYLFTSYREHGYALARGADPGQVMAELFGRVDGMSGGRGGSMHLFDPKIRLLGGYGIVGGQLPLATGAAFALAYRGAPGPDSPAVMCLLGDATTNIGAFHESLNLAALWRLPIVYVIVNNQLGMGTPVEAAAAEPELWKRGCSYRMPGQRVDGNDVLAVRDAARAGLQRARGEHQPMLLETVSYRLRGHSVVDPAKYRTAEDTERLRQGDPLPAFRARLVAAAMLDEKAARQIDAEVDKTVGDAVDYADASPAPEVSTLFDYVYATPVANTYHGLPGDPVVVPDGPDG
jgi:pyruvate dehydrogenase E1 component subunit alpha